MSFANKIIPRLGQSADDSEWYVNAMYQSLNEYMTDIEIAMARPQFTISRYYYSSWFSTYSNTCNDSCWSGFKQTYTINIS